MSIPEQVQRLFREAETLTAHGRGHVQLHRQLHAHRQQDIETLHAYVTTLLGDPNTSPLQGAAASGLYAAHHRQMARARFMLSHHDQHLQQLSGWLDEFEGLYQQYRPLILGAMGLIPGPIWDFLANHVAIPSLADVVLYGDGMMPNLQAVWDGLAGEAVSFLENMGSDFIQGVGNFLGSVFWTGTSTFGMTGGSSGPSATQVHQQVSSSLSSPSSNLTSFASQTQAQHQKVQKEYYGGCGNCCQGEHDYTLPPDPPDSKLTLSRKQLTQQAEKIHTMLSGGTPITYAGFNQDFAPLLNGLTPADIAALENIYSQKYHADIQFDLMTAFVGDAASQYLITQIFSPNSIQSAPLAMQSGPTPRFIMKPPLDPIVAAQPGGSIPYAKYQFSLGKLPANAHLSYSIIGPDGHLVTLTEPILDPSQAIQVPLEKPGPYTIVVRVWYGDNLDESNPPVQFYTCTQIAEPPNGGALQALRNQLFPPMDPQVYLAVLQGQVQQLQQVKNPTQQQQDYLKELREQIQNIKQYLLPDNNGGKDPTRTGPIPISAVFVDGQSSQSLPLLIYAVQKPDGKWEIVDLTDPEHPGHYDEASTIDGAWQSFMQNNHYPDGQIAAAPPQRPYGYTGPFPAPSQPWNQRNDQKGWVQNLTNFFNGTSLALLVLGIGLQFIPGVDVLGDIALAGAAASGAIAGGLDLYSLVRYSRVDPHDPEVQLDFLAIAGALALGGGAIVKPLTETGSAVLISTGKAAYTSASVILAQNYYDQIQLIQTRTDLNSDQKQQAISDILQNALANGGLIFLGIAGGFLREIPPATGDWTPVCDEITTRLSGLLGVNSSIPADALKQIFENADLRQAMLGYLGVGTDANPQEALKALNGGQYEVQLKQMSSDFVKWWNDYNNPATGVPDGMSFRDYVLTYRGENSLSLTPYENARVTETVKAAENENAQLQAQGKQPKYDPQLLAAIADGQNLAVRVGPDGSLEITTQSGVEVQAALINVGYNLDTIQSWWQRYKSQRANQAVDSPTFGDYLPPNHISVQLGAPGRVPIKYHIDGFDGMSFQKQQLELLTLAEPDLVRALSTNEFLDTKQNHAVQELIQSILNQDLLGGKVTGDTLLDIGRQDLMKVFNQQLGQGLAQRFANGQISMKDVADVLRILNESDQGSVGEWFVYTLFNGKANGWERHGITFNIEDTDIQAILNDPDYKRDGKDLISPALQQELQRSSVTPDETDGKQPPDALDVKTFTTSDIDQAQLLKYAQLMKSRPPRLQHLSYLFMPGDPAEGTAENAALRAWNTVSKYGLTSLVDVYYLDESGTLWHVEPGGTPQEVPGNNSNAVYSSPSGH
jgi:hypothetical protein